MSPSLGVPILLMGLPLSFLAANVDAVQLATILGSVVALVSALVALNKTINERKASVISAVAVQTDTALKAMTELNQRLVSENERMDEDLGTLRVEVATLRRDLSLALTENARLTLRVGALETEQAVRGTYGRAHTDTTDHSGDGGS